MNLCCNLRPARLVQAIGAALVAIVLHANVTRAAGAANTPGVFVSIAFPAGARTDPASDAPPTLIELTPIELPAQLATSAKAGTSGAFHLAVDETGTVRGLSFSDRNRAGPFVKPIETAVMRWRFDPVVCDGKVKSVKVPLVYRVLEPLNSPGSEAAEIQIPRPLFRVEPTLIPALTRRGPSLIQPYVVNGAPQMQTVQVPVRGSDGTTQIVSRQIQVPGPPRVEYLGPWNPPPNLPWLAAYVVLSYDVDVTGMARNFAVDDSSCPILDAEAVAAMSAWRFTPALEDGQPVLKRFRDRLTFAGSKDVHPPKLIRPATKKTADARWDTPPTFVRLSLPIYPQELASRKIEGRARVDIRLDETGQMVAVTIAEATQDAFGEALRAALLTFRFDPARRRGKPTSAAFSIEARFTRDPENMPLDEPRLPAVLLDYPSDAAIAPSSKLDAVPKLLVGRPPTLDPRLQFHDGTSEVVLEITIDPTGRVKAPMVVTTPQPELGYVAIQAVSSWLFAPPMAQGKHVATRVRVPVTVGCPVANPTSDPSAEPPSKAVSGR